jgi:hypothetical protein
MRNNLIFFQEIKQTFDYLLSVFDDLNYVQFVEEKMVKYEVVRPYHQSMEY